MKVYVSSKEGFGAIEAKILHLCSPSGFFAVGDVAPALLANGTFFAVNHDVEFDVFAGTCVFPGVFTVFHSCFLHCISGSDLALFAFKAS